MKGQARLWLQREISLLKMVRRCCRTTMPTTREDHVEFRVFLAVPAGVVYLNFTTQQRVANVIAANLDQLRHYYRVTQETGQFQVRNSGNRSL